MQREWVQTCLLRELRELRVAAAHNFRPATTMTTATTTTTETPTTATPTTTTATTTSALDDEALECNAEPFDRP